MQSRKKRQTFAILFIQSRKLHTQYERNTSSNCIVKFITSTLFFESSTHTFQNYYSFFLTIPSSFLVEIESRPGRLHDAYKWNNYKPIVAPLRKGRIYLIICIDDLVIVIARINLVNIRGIRCSIIADKRWYSWNWMKLLSNGYLSSGLNKRHTWIYMDNGMVKLNWWCT